MQKNQNCLAQQIDFGPAVFAQYAEAGMRHSKA
jgi:hypothetical protein